MFCGNKGSEEIMANIKKNPLAPKKKKKVPTKECLGCHEEKKLTEFYQA